MLCDLIEGGRTKCCAYFPQGPVGTTITQVRFYTRTFMLRYITLRYVTQAHMYRTSSDEVLRCSRADAQWESRSRALKELF